jgi:hypothetical protein
MYSMCESPSGHHATAFNWSTPHNHIYQRVSRIMNAFHVRKEYYMIQKLRSRLIRPTIPITSIAQNTSSRDTIHHAQDVLGMNKTGTTSISIALTQLGYTVTDQASAEILIRDLLHVTVCNALTFVRHQMHFTICRSVCHLPNQAFDQHYPNSKFILTIQRSTRGA